MATPDEQRDDTATGAAWLSVARASQLAGISKRAMQKRAALGQIGARKIGDGSAARWEIDGRELTANSGANCELWREPRTDDRELSANSTANHEPTGRELWREREVELKAEITFLRSVVESDRRDMAELRAALRKALDLAPKQLTAGDASQVASDAPQRDESGEMSNHSPKAPNAVKSAENRGQTGLSYGDLADELERRLDSRRDGL